MISADWGDVSYIVTSESLNVRFATQPVSLSLFMWTFLTTLNNKLCNERWSFLQITSQLKERVVWICSTVELGVSKLECKSYAMGNAACLCSLLKDWQQEDAKVVCWSKNWRCGVKILVLARKLTEAFVPSCRVGLGDNKITRHPLPMSMYFFVIAHKYFQCHDHMI